MPIRVEALPDDVVIDVVLFEMIEKPPRDRPIAAAVDVDHDAHAVRGGRGAANAADSGGKDARQVIPLPVIVVRLRWFDDSHGAVENFHS